MGRIREATIDSVIFGSSNGREEVQNLRGQGVRGAARYRRENCEDRATWQEMCQRVTISDPIKRMPGQYYYPSLTCQGLPMNNPNQKSESRDNVDVANRVSHQE